MQHWRLRLLFDVCIGRTASTDVSAVSQRSTICGPGQAPSSLSVVLKVEGGEEGQEEEEGEGVVEAGPSMWQLLGLWC